MDTDVLRYFQQIADGMTVTDTADIFQVTQPAVSRALRRLDEQVGVALLERVGRNLRTTHAGRVFKSRLDSCLHALDDGLAAVEELLDPETGIVRIAFQPSLGSWLVPRLVASFRQARPQVQFALESVGDSSGSARLAQGHADLQLTARRPRSPDVSWQRLIRQPLCLAVSVSHRFAGRASVDLRDASGEDFVLLTPDWALRSLVDELCEHAGFTPRVSFAENDMLVVRGFVAAGLGVSVVPWVPEALPQGGGQADRLIPLSDSGAFREVGVAWASDRKLLPSAVLFREHAVLDASRLSESFK